jgi:transcriptional regulator with XRE-family HTH domain
MPQVKIRNVLEVTRRMSGKSRKEVSQLLGYRGTSALQAYERGISWPPLQTALRLEIIYRKPVAYLYPDLYAEWQKEIRAKEEQAEGGQSYV